MLVSLKLRIPILVFLFIFAITPNIMFIISGLNYTYMLCSNSFIKPSTWLFIEIGLSLIYWMSIIFIFLVYKEYGLKYFINNGGICAFVILLIRILWLVAGIVGIVNIFEYYCSMNEYIYKIILSSIILGFIECFLLLIPIRINNPNSSTYLLEV